MSYTCTLYSGFQKKLNSTRQPSGGTSYPCLIKHDTDFKNPVLEIEAEDLTGVNYMQFNGEFFYVTSLIAHRNNIYEVAGLRDPMATYKEQIGATEAYILYSNNSFDASAELERIPDERIAVRKHPTIFTRSVPFKGGGITISPKRGSYLLSAVGESGGVTSYILDHSSMSDLVNGLGVDTYNRIFDAFDAGTAPTTTEEVLTMIRNGFVTTFSNEIAYGNYAQCIKACSWIPFEGFGGLVQRIYLGDYDTGVVGYVAGAGESLVRTFMLSIPIVWNYDDWRRCYYQITLYIPFFGTFVLPADKINNAEEIIVYVSIDLIGGTVSASIECDGVILEIAGCNAGAPYAIGSSNITLQNFMNGAAQVVGGAINAATGILPFTGGSIGGGITSMVGGVVECVTPAVQCAGSVGGLSACGLDPNVVLMKLDYSPLFVDEFQALYGHPVMRVGTPDAGYNMFRGFSVSCDGTPEEISQINSYFNTGAYYE